MPFDAARLLVPDPLAGADVRRFQRELEISEHLKNHLSAVSRACSEENDWLRAIACAAEPDEESPAILNALQRLSPDALLGGSPADALDAFVTLLCGSDTPNLPALKREAFPPQSLEAGNARKVIEYLRELCLPRERPCAEPCRVCALAGLCVGHLLLIPIRHRSDRTLKELGEELTAAPGMQPNPLPPTLGAALRELAMEASLTRKIRQLSREIFSDDRSLGALLKSFLIDGAEVDWHAFPLARATLMHALRQIALKDFARFAEAVMLAGAAYPLVPCFPTVIQRFPTLAIAARECAPCAPQLLRQAGLLSEEGMHQSLKDFRVEGPDIRESARLCAAGIGALRARFEAFPAKDGTHVDSRLNRTLQPALGAVMEALGDLPGPEERAPLRATNDHVFLITGAAGGLGAVIVQRLLDTLPRDCLVVATSRLESLPKILARHPRQDRLLVRPLDVRRRDEADALFDEFRHRQLDFHALIGNAALCMRGFKHDFDRDESRENWEVNYHGPVGVAKRAVEFILETGHGGGNILFVSSAAIYYAFPTMEMYAAQKRALFEAARSLGNDPRLSSAGIRVATIVLGCLRSESFQGTCFPEKTRHAIRDGEAVRDVIVDTNRLISLMMRYSRLSPEAAADRIARLAMSPAPPPLTNLGLDTRLLVLTQPLPLAMKDFATRLLLRAMRRLDRTHPRR
jgi:NAD(P)-dependent dehydrogenase (short-subunit alcohol dehydrogenase family)